MSRTLLPFIAMTIVIPWCGRLLAQEPTASDQAGDTRRIEFMLPFERALEIASDENRLIFLKPIYGGVDEAGYADYRCGSW